MLEVRGVGMLYPRLRGLLRYVVRTATDHEVVALRGVDLQVAGGEVVGLVGPNGAGKTTLLKIISTLLQPTTGRVLVDGYDPSHDARAVRDRIGLVLADDRALYWRLTGRENLEFFGVMHGLTRRDARARAGILLDQVGLASRDKLVFGYSSGMRARLSLARALLARPPLLLLDEPTRALDPIACAAVAGMIRDLADEGIAVLLSSHRLD
jgi:ABC-2 type transport system ATP-binding protein